MPVYISKYSLVNNKLRIDEHDQFWDESILRNTGHSKKSMCQSKQNLVKIKRAEFVEGWQIMNP